MDYVCVMHLLMCTHRYVSAYYLQRCSTINNMDKLLKKVTLVLWKQIAAYIVWGQFLLLHLVPEPMARAKRKKLSRIKANLI